MKPSLLIPAVLTVVMAISGCNETSYEADVLPSKPATPAAFNVAGVPVVEFSLPDMMCEEGCAAAVKDILEEQPGVRDVRVDFDAKTATVAVDEGAFSSERTLAELVDKGFDNSRLADAGSASDDPISQEAEAGEVE